jgi:hypothetical protein
MRVASGTNAYACLHHRRRDARRNSAHIRCKGGHTASLTTVNPKASWQKVKTLPEIVQLLDQLIDEQLYAEIADILNADAWISRRAATSRAARIRSRTKPPRCS